MKAIHFRPIEHSDQHRLFEWLNDSERLYWLRKEDPRHYREDRSPYYTEYETGEVIRKNWNTLFVAELITKKYFPLPESFTPFGTILLQNRGEKMLGIPWFVSPDFRGRGLGKRMVKRAVKVFPCSKKAIIHKDNIASQRIANHVGFQFKGRSGEMLVYIWDDGTF